MALLKLLWNEEKNIWLKQKRGLSFESVVLAYESGHVLDDLIHPQATRPHQRIMIIEIDSYVCMVPYVTDGQTAFLKTIYQSRVLQKKYRGHT